MKPRGCSAQILLLTLFTSRCTVLSTFVLKIKHCVGCDAKALKESLLPPPHTHTLSPERGNWKLPTSELRKGFKIPPQESSGPIEDRVCTRNFRSPERLNWGKADRLENFWRQVRIFYAPTTGSNISENILSKLIVPSHDCTADRPIPRPDNRAFFYSLACSRP